MCHDFCSDRPQSSHSQASTATKPNGGMALLAVEEYPPSPHEAQQILAESWEARCQEAPAWEGPKDPKNPKGMGVWRRSP